MTYAAALHTVARYQMLIGFVHASSGQGRGANSVDHLPLPTDHPHLGSWAALDKHRLRERIDVIGTIGLGDAENRSKVFPISWAASTKTSSHCSPVLRGRTAGSSTRRAAWFACWSRGSRRTRGVSTIRAAARPSSFPRAPVVKRRPCLAILVVMSDVTQILNAIELGDPLAAEQLLPLVYDELRRLAKSKLACEKPGHTLQATALVHEAYLRLVGNAQAGRAWDGRGHFFAAAAEGMRRILVENARRKHRLRHGGDLERVDLDDELAIEAPEPREDLLALDVALDKLKQVDRTAADLVQLRYFAGLTLAGAAEMLDISTRSADRIWAYSKAWLHREMT